MAALACVTEKISLKACVRRSRPCLLCLLGVAWLAGSASPLLASPEPLPLSRSESQGHADALEAMLTRAELLEETKRVRKLEVEILELEERARRQKTVQKLPEKGNGQKYASAENLQVQDEEKRQKLSEAQITRQVPPKERYVLPWVKAVEGRASGKGGREDRVVTLLFAGGRLVRLAPGESYRGLRILSVSRDGVRASIGQRIVSLDFAP